MILCLSPSTCRGIRVDAFNRLLQQTNTRLSDDLAGNMLTFLLHSFFCEFPLFPYRMQVVVQWDEATNWRVLQASAHQDICISLESIEDSEMDDSPPDFNIFDHWAELTMERIEGKGLLGVVMETVRTFLAEWLVACEHVPVWDPVVPTSSFEFGLNRASVLKPDDGRDIMSLKRQLTTTKNWKNVKQK